MPKAIGRTNMLSGPSLVLKMPRKSKVLSGRKWSFGESGWQLEAEGRNHISLTIGLKERYNRKSMGQNSPKGMREWLVWSPGRRIEARTEHSNRSERRVRAPTQRSTRVLWPTNRNRIFQQSDLPMADLRFTQQPITANQEGYRTTWLRAAKLKWHNIQSSMMQLHACVVHNVYPIV